MLAKALALLLTTGSVTMALSVASLFVERCESFLNPHRGERGKKRISG